MATIVKYTRQGDLEGRRYILLGAGYGMFESARSSILLGDLFPARFEGFESKLAVCDAEGKVLWGHSDDLVVVSIDGRSPAEALGASGSM